MIQREDYHLDGAVELPSTMNFDSLNEHQSKMRVEYIQQEQLGKRAIVIKNFLTKNECQELINFIESKCDQNGQTASNDLQDKDSDQIKMVPAASTTAYRNNLRMLATSSRISQIFYERLAYILTQLGEDVISCNEQNSHQFLHDGFGMNGIWKLTSLNPCFRLCKYNPLGHFGPHYDSDYVIDPIDHRSLKTFMIYLNPCRNQQQENTPNNNGHDDESEENSYLGGETNFCTGHDMYYDDARGIYCSPSHTIFSSLCASIGDCLIFDHHILHEGAQVISGMKYILRSDVMYQKTPHVASDEITEECLAKERKKEEAIRLYHEGMKLEESGDIDGGISYYRRAYKMCPELEQQMT